MPAEIQLCVFEKKFEEPSGSGYCQKLETFFRACEYTKYEVVHSTISKAPKGKLPFIILDGKQHIADSHFIIRHLIREGRIKDLDQEAGLTPVQLAESRAWQAYIEELVYPAAGWTRFAYPENFEILKQEAFAKVPIPIRWILIPRVKSRVKKSLIIQGVGRHSQEEVDSIIEDFVENITARLHASNGEFFHGKSPSVIDCVMYGNLVNALRMKSNPAYIKLILSKEILKAYIACGTRLWFPEYAGILEMVKDQADT